jgi:CRP-like cAMP-binding protein
VPALVAWRLICAADFETLRARGSIYGCIRSGSWPFRTSPRFLPERSTSSRRDDRVEVEPGDTVVHVDDYGRAIYLIEAGNADVLDDHGDAMQVLGPGDTFGEIGLLLTGQRTATVVARTPMRLLSLSGQGFDGIDHM